MIVQTHLAVKQARARRLRRAAATSLLALGVAISPIAFDLGAAPALKVAHASSCFIGGTRVLMANFEEKPIELVEIGDYVLAPDGEANRVIGIETPNLGVRKLYGVDGGRPFVTAEHPFMTKRGWLAIDPAATAEENPTLIIGRLAETDRLAVANYQSPGATSGTLALAPALSLAYVPVRAISEAMADPSTRLYNLLLDGSHTYFADGYLVHNKGGDGGGGGSGSGGSGSGGEGGSSGSGSSSGSSGEGGEGGNSGPSSSSGGEGGESGPSSSSGGEGGESGDDSGGESGESSSPDSSTDNSSDDDGTPDQGPGDAPGTGTGDDGTPDQGPGDN